VILHPAVLAVLAASFAALAAVATSSGVAVAVLRRWDLASGAQAQLRLERRTYLASTALRWACALQLGSLFLFVHTADAMAPLFSGAMCAAGTLQANRWGYLALAAKVAGFVAAGVWLVVNHVDEQAHDHPLVRYKYRLVLLLLPLFALDAGLVLAYFRGLEPEVITTCCGSLFGRKGQGLAADLAGLPAGPTAGVAGLLGLATVAAAAVLRRTGQGAFALSVLGAAAAPAGIAAVVAFVSPFVYELPHHHCPFCMLKADFGHVGYAVYAMLLAAAVAALAAGAVARHRGVPSLASALPRAQRGLALTVIAGMGGFLAVATWSVLASRLRP